MKHICLNAEISLMKLGSWPKINVVNITDSFGFNTYFSSTDDKPLRYAPRYLKDFDNQTITSKQLLSNTKSKYYKYIDQFIESKSYTHDVLLSELIGVKVPDVNDILLNRNTDVEINETDSSTYKVFNIFSLFLKPSDVSFSMLHNNLYHDIDSTFEDTSKNISRYCELRSKRNERNNLVDVEIVARRYFNTFDTFDIPVIIDIDYDVKLINNDALITVNVTETEIHR